MTNVNAEGVFLHNTSCIHCDSSDAMGIYEKEDGSYNGYCRSTCMTENNAYKSHNQLARSHIGQDMGIQPKRRGNIRSANRSTAQPAPKPKSSKAQKPKAKSITQELRDKIESNSSLKGNGFRGIKDKYLKYYGVRTEFDPVTGDVKYRYYPATINRKILTAYKKRIVETKDFFPEGKLTKQNDLFGQFRCKGGGKYLLITGGEEDTLAALQMIDEYRMKKGRSKIAQIDVVSSSIGETSCAEQLKIHYDFIDSYENIIIDMDMDNAGRDALQAILDVVPAAKTKVMIGPAKDANEALNERLEAEYIAAFYQAKRPQLAGVISGRDLLAAAIEAVSQPLISLPPEFKPLQEKLAGGLPVGEIINILAASGVGKTTISNLLLTHWIFHSPYKVGICSLEAGAGKFTVRLLSGYLKKNIHRLPDVESKRQYILDHEEEALDLFLNEEGEERFTLVDDKGDLDNLNSVKKTIERMIRFAGCRIIVIDPLQDLLDTLCTEDQAAFIAWQKKIKARDGVTFININHTRKSGGGGRAGSQGGMLTEEDMQGTSAIYKSGAVNIVIRRDKTAEDPEERNTTQVYLPKSRDAGDTGPAGELYYEIESATLYNKEDWLINRGV